MEAILQTINESQYSSQQSNGWLNERQVSFSDIINGMLHSQFRNIQWLLPAIFSLSVALLTKLICDVYTYKKKVDITYLYMEENISDIKELADILKNYTTSQHILERGVFLACNKENENETQINNMKSEIALLKITIQSMDGSNTVNMEAFVTAVLNYLQNYHRETTA
ncbi:uncharacterized protein LOC126088321 [Schistocerca cancellata]|uniref:uncharacterized protein LOC126088321 n=1 Tax=Schistocerca cancellata TaxID=274614 RepID=UPI002117FDDB|nr:uncharacterized protein LOC126088321 [Schistocerca cancellata]